MLSNLIEALRPPLNPVETGHPEDWTKIETDIGVALPQDYKAFIGVYGSGRIGNRIYIWNPFSSISYLNFMEQMQRTLDGLRILKTQGKTTLNVEDPPYPLFPELGGVLPFAATIAGDVVFWKTRGKPDEWPIIIQRVRSFDYEEHSGPITEFMTRLIRRDIPKTFLYGTFDLAAGFKTIVELPKPADLRVTD